MSFISLPDSDEIEVSLLGPGYGECVLVHLGYERWAVVDSHLDEAGQPIALSYLMGMGVDPSEAVRLIVATHWHDDHILGMEQLVEVCENATFCCASALVNDEFLALIGVLNQYTATPAGSGAEELYGVFALLRNRSQSRAYALSDRLIYSQSDLSVWALSPSDRAYEIFLRRVSQLLPGELETEGRIPSLRPNDASVVLLIEVDDNVLLLGADLERPGWLDILDSDRTPYSRASVFKVPHHGSQSAHDERIWSELLTERPIAALTPWGLGGNYLPTEADVSRILSYTDSAYITALPAGTGGVRRRRHRIVDRSIRESGVALRSVGGADGMVRLRKKLGVQGEWRIELIGSARQLTGA